MKSYKFKKSRIAITLIAVSLIVCMLTVLLAGCNKAEVGVTPIDVFFVGNMQKDVTDTSSLVKEGKEIVEVDEMLETEGWTLESNPYEVIAGIYALAVTNYNSVNRSLYYIMTDASVNAFKCSNLMNKDVNVGIRSTYSVISGKNGNFSQTVSGVTILDGLGSAVSSLRSNFGWNTQTYSNSEFSIDKKGFTAGAQFYGAGNNEANATKYIMGAGNPKLDKRTDYSGTLIKPSTGTSKPPVSDREYPWSELDQLDEGTITVDRTEYYLGSYGAGWATSNYSKTEYFDKEKTSISYDADLDLYTLNITVLPEYADEANDFTKGLLVRDTKDYIALKNAVYTQSTAKIEVYGSGLIKSMQNIDTLESNEKCNLTVAGGIFGSCEEGGRTQNRITRVFSYDEDDCDALKYCALYWPELNSEKTFKKAKIGSVTPLDLSGYADISSYKPQINDLKDKFESLYSYDWSTYKLEN